MTKVMIVKRETYKALAKAKSGFSILAFVHAHSNPNGTADVSAGGDSKPVKCKVKPVSKEALCSRSTQGINSIRMRVQLTKR